METKGKKVEEGLKQKRDLHILESQEFFESIKKKIAPKSSIYTPRARRTVKGFLQNPKGIRFENWQF